MNYATMNPQAHAWSLYRALTAITEYGASEENIAHFVMPMMLARSRMLSWARWHAKREHVRRSWGERLVPSMPGVCASIGVRDLNERIQLVFRISKTADKERQSRRAAQAIKGEMSHDC